MIEALSYDFFRNALLAGLLASVICGVIGSLVVVNRIVFLAGGVAHASYGGVGLAFFLGLPVLPVTAGFSTAAVYIFQSFEQGDPLRGMAMAVLMMGTTFTSG